ncbi:hypothetical protein GOODEAATRI_015411, partial [Goodea atripinnis]
NLNSVILHLSPFTYYEFRVIAINEIGSSRPSRPSKRFQTSGALNTTRGEELKVEEFPPNVTSFSIRRYDRYTRYRFSVAARTQIGQGDLCSGPGGYFHSGVVHWHHVCCGSHRADSPHSLFHQEEPRGEISRYKGGNS